MKVRGKPRIKLIEREVVDTDTGEIGTDIDPVQVGISYDLGQWYKIQRIDNDVEIMALECLGVPFMVFYTLLKRAVWDDCSVEVGVSCRAAIGKNAKIKDGMIAKYLAIFCKEKLLKKIKGNSYKINPRYFFVGGAIEQFKKLKEYEQLNKQV